MLAAKFIVFLTLACGSSTAVSYGFYHVSSSSAGTSGGSLGEVVPTVPGAVGGPSENSESTGGEVSNPPQTTTPPPEASTIEGGQNVDTQQNHSQ